MVGQSRIRGKKDDNVSSHNWIALKVLQEFSDEVFLAVGTESLLVDEEVRAAKLK